MGGRPDADADSDGRTWVGRTVRREAYNLARKRSKTSLSLSLFSHGAI